MKFETKIALAFDIPSRVQLSSLTILVVIGRIFSVLVLSSRLYEYGPLCHEFEIGLGI